jgi:hypothetical protein
MNKADTHEMAQAIRATFISPNCFDSNLEPANIVDAIYYLSEALYRLATIAESFISQAGKKGEAAKCL